MQPLETMNPTFSKSARAVSFLYLLQPLDKIPLVRESDFQGESYSVGISEVRQVGSTTGIWSGAGITSNIV
jgi:hypothetical protein